MRKRIKHKAVGRAPQGKQPVPNGVSERTETQSEKPQVQGGKPQAIETDDKLFWQSECVFQQFYEITISDQLIEERAFRHYSKEDRAELLEEYSARFKRMLRSLVKDEKAIYAVCQWLVYRQPEEADTYVREAYGRDKTLAEILQEHIDCFDEDVSEDDIDRLADFLFEDIEIEPSGFNVLARLGTGKV